MTVEITDDVRITRINGSMERGGWQCSFTAMMDTDLVETNQRIIVQWIPALGTGPSGDPRTAFIGYVMPNRFSFDRTQSSLECVAETSDGFLRKGWCQGIGFADRDTTARAHYHQFDSVTGGGDRMTLGKIVRHLLGYHDALGVPPVTNPDWVAHTNLVYHAADNPHGWITLNNVEVDDSVRVDRYNVRETDNLWSRLQEIANNEFFLIYFDKADTLWYQPHPMYQAVLPSPVMTFDEDFIVTPPIIELRTDQIVQQVIMHSVTDDGDTLHAKYPDTLAYVYGRKIEFGRLRCNEQATLDDWCERHYLYLNRDYSVRWTAPGLCGLLFEIGDRIQVTYTGTSYNGVHVDWTKKKFWIHEIDVVPGVGFGGTTTFSLEAESI